MLEALNEVGPRFASRTATSHPADCRTGTRPDTLQNQISNKREVRLKMPAALLGLWVRKIAPLDCAELSTLEFKEDGSVEYTILSKPVQRRVYTIGLNGDRMSLQLLGAEDAYEHEYALSDAGCLRIRIDQEYVMYSRSLSVYAPATKSTIALRIAEANARFPK